MPKSNVNYWKNKLYKNKECDEQNQKELKEMGGECHHCTGCQLKRQTETDT